MSFISTWKTDNPGTSNSDQITLPLVSGGTYNFQVDWGDGNSDTITAYNDPAVTHTYASAGTYTVTITGTINGWKFNNGGDCQKITNISQWGQLLVSTDGYQFYGCSNMTCTATDTLDVSAVTNMTSMFRNCSSFNSDMSNWDVSNVTDMQFMFYNCSSFSSDLSNWDVSNVTNTAYMFTYCSSFSSDLSNWDVSNVTNMQYMFYNCSSFNSDLSNWDVSNVTNMYRMFYGCSSFTSDLSSWNVSNVTSMREMFRSCSSFNSDMSNWDVSNVTDMQFMFYNCSSFSSDLSNWDVSNVTNTAYMFTYCSSFSSDLSNWDVSNVTDMQFMFYNCSSFNSDLSNWDVSNVKNMHATFVRCSLFTSDLSNWDISNVTNMTDMFHGCTLTTEHYDAILLSWSQQSVHDNINIHFGNSKYSQDPIMPATFDGISLAHYLDGAIAKMAYGGQGTLPTEAEITQLYNGGNGLTYAELPASIEAKVTHAWNCNEGSDGSSHVPLYDAKGTNDGTEVGGELLTDGGLEEWDSSTDLTHWMESTSGSSTVNQETSDFHSGSSCCRFDVDSSNSKAEIYQSTTNAITFDVSAYAKSPTSGARLKLGTDYESVYNNLTPSWQKYQASLWANGARNIYCRGMDGAPCSVYLDDISVKSPYILSTAGPRVTTAEDIVGDNDGALQFSDPVSAWKTDVPDVPNVSDGTSLEFDGSSDNVDLSVMGDTYASGSLALWVKRDALTSSTIGLIDLAGSGANGLLLFTDTNGVVDLQVGDGSTVHNNTHSATLPTGVWTFVAATWDADTGTVKVCVNDGIETLTSGGTVSVDASSYHSRIGSHAAVSGRYFKGKLDNVMLSENVLSDSEMLALYQGTDPSTSLTAHWPFDDGPQGGTPADGDTIVVWQSRDGSRTQLLQPTTSRRPLLHVDARNKKWLEFDGADDYLKIGDAVLSGTATSFFIAVDGIAQTGTHILFATSDEATSNKYYAVAIVNDNITVYQYDGTTLMTLTGSTALVGGKHIIGIFSDGTTTTCTLDGNAETLTGTDTGNTWGDTPDRDNLTIGALVNTEVNDPADGNVARTLCYERTLSATEQSAVASKLASIYGVS